MNFLAIIRPKLLLGTDYLFDYVEEGEIKEKKKGREEGREEGRGKRRKEKRELTVL